jgi:hypothetical protein
MELQDFKPKIWRLFEVSGNATVAKLCYYGMVLYRVGGCHLFSMDVNKLGIHFEFKSGDPSYDDDFPYELEDPSKYKLRN